MIDLEIRNATKEQWPIVADMARANLGVIERRGVNNGIALRRGDLSVYLYLTHSGKSATAHVNTED